MPRTIPYPVPVSLLLAAVTLLTGCKKQQSRRPNLRSPEDAAAVMRREAQATLTAIALAALQRYRSNRVDRNGMLLGKQFPKSTGMTPKEPCCKSPDLTCHPKDAEWHQPTWQALHFEPADRHLLQYEFLSCNVPGKEQFLVRAFGAPGCEKEHLVFELRVKPTDAETTPSLDTLSGKIREFQTTKIPKNGLDCPKSTPNP